MLLSEIDIITKITKALKDAYNTISDLDLMGL